MARRLLSHTLSKTLSNSCQWQISVKGTSSSNTATCHSTSLTPLSSLSSPSPAFSFTFQKAITTNSLLLANGRGGDQTDLLGGSSRSRDSKVPDNLSSDDIRSEPMVYDFSGMPPDEAASKLADSVKLNMWTLHKEHPDIWTVERLATEYKIRRQRVHAILWLKDIEKKMEEERGESLPDDIEKEAEEFHGSFTKGAGEKHWKVTRNSNPLLSDEENFKKWEEDSLKEDQMKLGEFETRMRFNKRLMNGEIFVKKESRRRPEGGWSYMVEELGEEGRIGRKRGGTRFIAEPGGVKRELSELEKEFWKREMLRPRRRTVPR